MFDISLLVWFQRWLIGIQREPGWDFPFPPASEGR